MLWNRLQSLNTPLHKGMLEHPKALVKFNRRMLMSQGMSHPAPVLPCLHQYDRFQPLPRVVQLCLTLSGKGRLRRV